MMSSRLNPWKKWSIVVVVALSALSAAMAVRSDTPVLAVAMLMAPVLLAVDTWGDLHPERRSWRYWALAGLLLVVQVSAIAVYAIGVEREEAELRRSEAAALR